MLDTKFIREHPEVVKKAAKNKGYDVDIDHVLAIDGKHRKLSISVQQLQEERNRAAKEKNIERGRELKDRLEKEEHELRAVDKELREWLLKVPNLPKDDVKVGKEETENEVVKEHGKPKKFDFSPKDHLELGELLDIIDVRRAAKVSGTRFAYLKNKAVLLEFALVQLALDLLTKEGFTLVVPPVLIKLDITKRLGYWTEKGHKDYFLVIEREKEENELSDFYLVGTAEHAIVPMHMDEVLNKNELPKRYVGFSTAFRREAGSYGRDTRGILRVHQFDKVEMISFVAAEDDDKEHEYLLSLEEKLLQLLDIPYRVVKMCTGDLGFPTARKYDIEAWMPSEDKYREVTSCSTTTDFQARRLNIKYLNGSEKTYVHILNATAFAIGRTIIAILENYQQEDGSVLVPKVLQKYVGKSEIRPS